MLEGAASAGALTNVVRKGGVFLGEGARNRERPELRFTGVCVFFCVFLNGFSRGFSEGARESFLRFYALQGVNRDVIFGDISRKVIFFEKSWDHRF